MSTCLCPSRPTPGDRLGGKIQAVHLAWYAIVYVRQSTMQQVDQHQESTRLQDALVDRAVALAGCPHRSWPSMRTRGAPGATPKGGPDCNAWSPRWGRKDETFEVAGTKLQRYCRRASVHERSRKDQCRRTVSGRRRSAGGPGNGALLGNVNAITLGTLAASARPDVEASDWRSVCGRTAGTVRR